MAKKHFVNGKPDLDLIASEIKDFFQNLPSYFSQLAAHILQEEFNLEDFLFQEMNMKDLVHLALLSSSRKPDECVDIEALYVVGSQANYLPDSYLLGNHDLDIVIKSDLFERNSGVAPLCMLMLNYYLNDVNEIPDSKEYLLDVTHIDQTNLLLNPYYQFF